MRISRMAGAIAFGAALCLSAAAPQAFAASTDTTTTSVSSTTAASCPGSGDEYGYNYYNSYPSCTDCHDAGSTLMGKYGWKGYECDDDGLGDGWYDLYYS